MGEYQVHRVRFFDYTPNAINCLSFGKKIMKLALSRSDGTVEIWSVNNVARDWVQEQILPPCEGKSVESLVWCHQRLFSSGLHGNLLEHDTRTSSVKHTVSANGGAVWCLGVNDRETMIAAGTEEGCVVLFQVLPNDLEYYKTLDKQEGRILCIAWCDAENVIVTGGIDNIRVWSINSGHAIQRLSLSRVDRNKPTIVWTVGIASDFTIVSGDSTGKVCFWNGRQGTQIASIQSHKADVLSLAVGPNGNTIVAAGVDPTMVQFEYTPVSPQSQLKRWVRTTIWNQHTHDVRSVIFTDETSVVSAGIDCQITISRVNVDKHSKVRLHKRLAPIPHESLVCVAHNKELLLLRYPERLEVWQLGKTHVSNTDNDGDILHLSQNHIKLVELRSKDNEFIISSAISPDGKWIVYCDKTKPKLYQFNFDENCPSEDISLRRVRYMPPEVQVSRCMCFTPDNTKLLIVGMDGNVQVIQLDAVHPTVCHTFKCPIKKVECVHLLTVSSNGRYVATGDTKCNIHVYDLQSLKTVCTLPRLGITPTAMSFHPTEPVIAVVCANRMIYEYDLENCEFTDWSRQFKNKVHNQWLNLYQTDKCQQIMYHPQHTHKLLLRDEERLYCIDQTQEFLANDYQLFQTYSKSHLKESTQENHCYHICYKYKFLMHLDILPRGQIVIVERPPGSITDELPPTLKLKKFGT